MRVGVNARTFTVEEPDGAVQTARKLTRQLGKRDDVNLVLYGDAQLKQEFDCADRICTAGFVSTSPYFGVLWERTVLPLLVDHDEIDVLLCPNGNAPLTPVDCPIVTYVHDVNAQRGMSSGIHGIYRRLAVPLGVRNSTAIVTVSDFSKHEITAYLPTDTDNVNVVYNGVDEFYLNDGGSERFDLPDEYLLYVGAMNPRKNVQRLVEAYGRIQNEIPHKLVLIGPQNNSVYKKMDVSSFSDEIITPGFLPISQLKHAYEHAAGFVYPSLYEGFGLPPLEALACGTPVVASDRTSLPEILDGFCRPVDPTDTDAIAEGMIEVATSEVTSEEADAMKKHAKQFTWKQATDDLIEVFQDALDVDEDCKSLSTLANLTRKFRRNETNWKG